MAEIAGGGLIQNSKSGRVNRGMAVQLFCYSYPKFLVVVLIIRKDHKQEQRPLGQLGNSYYCTGNREESKHWF